MDSPAADKPSKNGENYDGMFESEEEKLAGQADAWKYTFAFVDSLAVKSVVLLGIPDIIARHGPKATLSLSQIAAELPSQKPDVNCLFRILRFLVAKSFFRADTTGGTGEVRYGLTPASKWFLKEPSLSLTAMLLLEMNVTMMASWHYFNECVLHGGVAFEKAHGLHLWDYAAAHSDHNDLFNQAMTCNTTIVMKVILSKYEGYGSPFPGGKACWRRRVQRGAPADAVFMKWILHDWADEDCVKILKQCRKAIPETGKAIIVDAVLNAREKTERSEEEWKNLLKEAGFPRFNVIPIPALQSVIEAFPY
ncbi:hypothetical protein SUGI_0063240 [Cryptomeria japonica]|nr:hypothetical protein SUGI_0063240 [Cryptomeria japonica]